MDECRPDLGRHLGDLVYRQDTPAVEVYAYSNIPCTTLLMIDDAKNDYSLLTSINIYKLQSKKNLIQVGMGIKLK